MVGGSVISRGLGRYSRVVHVRRALSSGLATVWRNAADPRPSAFQAGHIPRWRGLYESYALSLVAEHRARPANKLTSATTAATPRSGLGSGLPVGA